MTAKRERWMVAAATLIVASFQLVLLSRRPPLSGDEGQYAINAIHIANGDIGSIVSYWSPLYSLLVAAPARLGVPPDVGGRLINALAVVLLVPAAAYVGSVAIGRMAGVLAAFLIATCPLVGTMGASALSDTTAVSLSTVIIALVIPRSESRAPRDERLPFALAGCLSLPLILIRSEMAYVLLLAALCAFANARRAVPRLAAFLASALVAACVTWAVARAVEWPAGYAQKGTITFSVGARGLTDDRALGERVVYGLTPDGEIDIDEAGRHNSLAMVASNARRLVRDWPGTLGNLARACASPLPLLLAPIALLVGTWSGERRLVPWVLGLGALVPFLIAGVAVPMPRLLLAVIPPLMILAAGSLALLAGRGADDKRRRRLLVCAALVILAPLPWTLARPQREIAQVPTIYRTTGLWMRENLPAGRVLARPGTYVAYYAGKPEYTFIPAAPARAIADFARKWGFDYLLLDGRLTLESRPGVAELLAADAATADSCGLALVHANDLSGPDRIVIYALNR